MHRCFAASLKTGRLKSEKEKIVMMLHVKLDKLERSRATDATEHSGNAYTLLLQSTVPIPT